MLCYSTWEIQKRQIEKSLEGVGAMVLSSYFLFQVFIHVALYIYYTEYLFKIHHNVLF
jgi:hypothetical protein